jgi:cysteine desulfurase
MNKKDREKIIYLDHASSAPIDPSVFRGMKKYFLKNQANPGAIHSEGKKARAAVEDSRKSTALSIGCHSDEVLFTSSGTESNNLAIQGISLEAGSGAHIVTTNIEHPSVIEVCKHLESRGVKVTYVPVEPSGIVDPEKVIKAIRKNTVLVSITHASNEIGTIQPIGEIAKAIRRFKKIKSLGSRENNWPFFHTDATQAMNYLETNVKRLGADLMTFNGSKIYGPKGIGVLYKKRGIKLKPLFFGGHQESGLRPGTENVPAIVGLSAALNASLKVKEKEFRRLTGLRSWFIEELKRKIPAVIINGDERKRLPNNVNISIPGISSEILVLELDARNIMVSTKSACKSDDLEMSHVIKAIRPHEKGDEGGLRISFGRGTRKEDLKTCLKALVEVVRKYQKWGFLK